MYAARVETVQKKQRSFKALSDPILLPGSVRRVAVRDAEHPGP